MSIGSAPDDGAAYVISIGPLPAQPDAMGGLCEIQKDSGGIHLALGFKGIPLKPTFPVTFTLAPHQDIIEAWRCERGSDCESFGGGVVVLERVLPNHLAVGQYELVPERGGAIERGSFRAVWCGRPIDTAHAPASP